MPVKTAKFVFTGILACNLGAASTSRATKFCALTQPEAESLSIKFGKIFKKLAVNLFLFNAAVKFGLMVCVH